MKPQPSSLENALSRLASTSPIASGPPAMTILRPNPLDHMTVPYLARMRRANEKSKDHAVAEGIAIAREMLERIKPLVQGVQVSAPFGKVELALQVFAQ